jgi:hypothetical protein
VPQRKTDRGKFPECSLMTKRSLKVPRMFPELERIAEIGVQEERIAVGWVVKKGWIDSSMGSQLDTDHVVWDNSRVT